MVIKQFKDFYKISAQMTIFYHKKKKYNKISRRREKYATTRNPL